MAIPERLSFALMLMTFIVKLCFVQAHQQREGHNSSFTKDSQLCANQLAQLHNKIDRLEYLTLVLLTLVIAFLIVLTVQKCLSSNSTNYRSAAIRREMKELITLREMETNEVMEKMHEIETLVTDHLVRAQCFARKPENQNNNFIPEGFIVAGMFVLLPANGANQQNIPFFVR